ncbi:MAG TPA: hypothetical protein VGJ20_38405 [Xanthobacteraceae bacterium]|jgi:hypothetical protein
MAEMNARNADRPTNIQAGSPLAGAIGGLNAGDRVTFSGEFIFGRKGRASERSITTGGSFRQPQILFRFTTINGVSGNEEPPMSTIVSTITDGEKLRSMWVSADSDCSRPIPSYSQARIAEACKDRAAIEARFRAIGWCFGKTKPGDADHCHQCGTVTNSKFGR